MNVLFALTRRAAGILGTAYDAEIVETHHRHKQDAPSGTALHLGECVADGRQQTLAEVSVHGREGHTGKRPAGEIGFHALRAGGVVGDHTVFLASEGERLELTHRAASRTAFAMGALRAVQWITGREPALYDMQDVLGLR
jgi:4-hydroxy-tetrahydrodipicolinate reductase